MQNICLFAGPSVQQVLIVIVQIGHADPLDLAVRDLDFAVFDAL